MNYTSKLLIISALLSSVAFGTGCRKKVSYQVADPASPPATQNSTPPPPAQKSIYYVVEGVHDDPRTPAAVSQVSILKPQMAVASLVSLTVGKEYSITHRCYDAKGKEIFKTDKPYVFTATASGWTAWTTFRPDYKIHTAGKWTWVVEVSGYGKLKAEIGVLPPTPDEMEDLARYEKARENVLRAFSRYWLGLDGTFHTVINYEQKLTAEEQSLLSRAAELRQKEQSLAVRISVTGPSRRQQWGPSLRHPGDTDNRDYWKEWNDELAAVRVEIRKLEELETKLTPTDPYLGYIQIAGTEWSMTKGGTSEADALNGITYRGHMSVSFRVFRYYRNGGWTDWTDCQRLPFMFSAIFGNLYDGVPSELSSRLNLSFSIMERDRNWFVTTSMGDEFANGKLQRADSVWKNEAPLESYALSLVQGARSFTRDSYRAMGADARQNPAVVEQSAIATMTMMRGKELIR